MSTIKYLTLQRLGATEGGLLDGRTLTVTIPTGTRSGYFEVRRDGLRLHP